MLSNILQKLQESTRVGVFLNKVIEHFAQNIKLLNIKFGTFCVCTKWKTPWLLGSLQRYCFPWFGFNPLKHNVPKWSDKVLDHFGTLCIKGLKLRSNKLNPLSANFTKWSNTLKQFVGKLATNFFGVFDHFVGLVLKGLRRVTVKQTKVSRKNVFMVDLRKFNQRRRSFTIKKLF